MKIEERETVFEKYYEALRRLHELDAIQDKYSDAHKDLFNARKKIYEYAGIEL